jgi:endoglucanase
LEAVVAGRDDLNLKRLATIVRDETPQIVLLRWGHEMDLPNLYPWSIDDPVLFRAAYRHVVDVFREIGADNARWVWSPAGTERMLDFYPGDDVVDYVGLTILGDATWDSLNGLPPQSFAQILKPRYRLLQPLDKPMILAEVGVSGSPDRQSAWLADARASIGDFSTIQAIVYFNAVNAPNNHRLTQPDWRLRPATFDRFVRDIETPGEPTRSPR